MSLIWVTSCVETISTTFPQTSVRYLLFRCGQRQMRSVRHINALLLLVRDFPCMVCATSRTRPSTRYPMLYALATSLMRMQAKCLIYFYSEVAREHSRSWKWLLAMQGCRSGWAAETRADRKSMQRSTNCFLSVPLSNGINCVKKSVLNLARYFLKPSQAVMRHSKSGHITESLLMQVLHFRQSYPTMRSQVASGRVILKYSLSKMVESALKTLKSALPLKMTSPWRRALMIWSMSCGATSLEMLSRERISSRRLMDAYLSMRCVVCVPWLAAPQTPSNTATRHCFTIQSSSLKADSNFSNAHRLVALTNAQLCPDVH